MLFVFFEIGCKISEFFFKCLEIWQNVGSQLDVPVELNALLGIDILNIDGILLRNDEG
jgi:hypothetical protein